MSDIKTIVYTGEAGVHRVPDFEGREYPIHNGVPTPVPAELADRLTQRDDFTYADELAPEPESTNESNGGGTPDEIPQGSTRILPTVKKKNEP